MIRLLLCYIFLSTYLLPAFDSPQACLRAALQALQEQNETELRHCYASPASQKYIAPLLMHAFRFQQAQKAATNRYDFTAVEDGFRTAPALYRLLEGAPDLQLLSQEHISRRNDQLVILETRKKLPDERVRVYRLRFIETSNGWFIDGPRQENQTTQAWFDIHITALDLVMPTLVTALQNTDSREAFVQAIQDAGLPAGEFMQHAQAHQKEAAEELRQQQNKTKAAAGDEK